MCDNQDYKLTPKEIEKFEKATKLTAKEAARIYFKNYVCILRGKAAKDQLVRVQNKIENKLHSKKEKKEFLKYLRLHSYLKKTRNIITINNLEAETIILKLLILLRDCLSNEIMNNKILDGVIVCNEKKDLSLLKWHANQIVSDAKKTKFIKDSVSQYQSASKFFIIGEISVKLFSESIKMPEIMGYLRDLDLLWLDDTNRLMRYIIEETRDIKTKHLLRDIFIPIPRFKPSQKAISEAKNIISMSLFDYDSNHSITDVYNILDHGGHK